MDHHRPPPLDEAAMDMEMSSIINDFLLSSRLSPDAHSPSTRLSKRKRFGGMWRFAARAVIKKRSSSSSSSCAPPAATSAAEAILSPGVANVLSPRHKKLISDAHHRLPDAPQQLYRKEPSSDVHSLVTTFEADNDSVSVDIPAVAVSEETPLPIPQERVCAMATMTMPHAKVNGDTQRNETCSPIKNYSGRKPPRPPRLVITRSGSYRTARVKAASSAARRATSVACGDSKKNQRSRKPSSTSITAWAFIVTLVFITIVFVQAFQRSREVPDFKFELGKRAVIHRNETTLHL